MGMASPPTCVHCGAVIEHVDKPYCSRCGKRWNEITPYRPSALRQLEQTVQKTTLSPSTSESRSAGQNMASQQREGELLRTSAPRQQPNSLNASRPLSTERQAPELRNTFSSMHKPLFSIPTTPTLTPDELRDKLRQLQEKMQPRSAVQEKIGQLRDTLQNAAVAPAPLPQIAQHAALTQDELLDKLRGLRAKVSEEQLRLAPLETREMTEIAPVWRYQLERVRKSIDFLESVRSEPLREREIRNQLSEALSQLDVTKPYRVALLDYSGNGTSLLLAALLGEDIFLRPFGTGKSSVRIVVRSCEANEQERLYLHFQDSNRPTEAYFRKEWREFWSEPEHIPADNPQKALNFVEFALHTSLLPPGGLLIVHTRNDEPLSATQLERMLLEIDALIVIVDGTSPNYAAVRQIIEQIRPKIVQKRTAVHAARMLFLAATYQSRDDTQENLEATTSNLRSLLPYLPGNYDYYHHHGAGKNYFFYPLWVIDAFFASVGMQRKALASDLQAEGEQYVGRLRNAYPKLYQLFPTLPATCEARSFAEVTPEQHEAMLRMSNIPELSHDLQDFLQDVRQRIQLGYARSAIHEALHLLEDFAWEKLAAQGLSMPSHSLETLEEALQTRETRRRTERRSYISRRIMNLKAGWDNALQRFEQATRNGGNFNLFHTSLQQAHAQAVDYVRQRIQLGQFDHYLENGTHTPQRPSTWTIDRLGREVHLWQLLGKMRSGLRVALEAALEQPAQELAQAFLIPLSQHEQEGGQLNVYERGLELFNPALTQIQKRYTLLKQHITNKAREACYSITIGELLHEERRMHRHMPVVRDMLDFVMTYEGPGETFQQQIHAHIEALLLELHKEMLQQTENSIIDYFRYELEILDQREIYENDLQVASTTEAGDFSLLLKDLEDLLVEQLRTSDEFCQKLNDLLYPNKDTVTDWYTLIKDVRKIKHTPIASRSGFDTQGKSS